MSPTASASTAGRAGRRRASPLATTIVLLVAAVAALLAWLQLSYVPPPPTTVTVAIRDGEILLPARPPAPLPPPDLAVLRQAPPGLPSGLAASAGTAWPDLPTAPATIASAATVPSGAPALAPLPSVGVPPRPAPPVPATAAVESALPPLAASAPAPPARAPSVTLTALPTLPSGGPAEAPSLGRPAPPPAAVPTAPSESPAAVPGGGSGAAPANLEALRLPPRTVETPGPPRPAWLAHARPFVARPGQGRVAIVLWGLGRSHDATSAAIQELPGEVTLSLTPYGRSLQLWADEARAAGHEVVLEVPMEPLRYPEIDPGPDALLTSLSAAENQRRLERLLDMFDGYVGVTNFMGSRFTTSPAHLRPVLETVKARGLIFLDSRASSNTVAFRLAGEIGLDRAINNRYIDNQASREAIDRRLAELERVAHRQGSAVGIGFPYLVTIERLSHWIPGLPERGLQLAPLSAVIEPGGTH